MGEQVAARFPWGYSSVGRAPALQAGGREFDPPWFHHYAVLAKLAFVRFSSLLLLLSQPKAYRLQTRFFGRTAVTADASAVISGYSSVGRAHD